MEKSHRREQFYFRSQSGQADVPAHKNFVCYLACHNNLTGIQGNLSIVYVCLGLAVQKNICFAANSQRLSCTAKVGKYSNCFTFQCPFVSEKVRVIFKEGNKFPVSKELSVFR